MLSRPFHKTYLCRAMLGKFSEITEFDFGATQKALKECYFFEDSQDYHDYEDYQDHETRLIKM